MPKMEVNASALSKAGNAASYAERVQRQVPGLQSLHQMVGVLLSERVSKDGHILVLGAGGGMELKALATQYKSWKFTGVDPSMDMLNQAAVTLGGDLERVTLVNGYIDDAPQGLFDGAVCLLTLHFLPLKERLRTVREIFRRLDTRSPLIVAHHSFPLEGGQKDLWLNRYSEFISASGVDVHKSKSSIKAMREKLPVLTPTEDENILEDAGFENIQLFYTAFTFKGWVAYKDNAI